MDKTLQDLSFVTIYLDDILVHSKNEEKSLSETGLTLRGAKCHIGMMYFQQVECLLILRNFRSNSHPLWKTRHSTKRAPR